MHLVRGCLCPRHDVKTAPEASCRIPPALLHPAHQMYPPGSSENTLIYDLFCSLTIDNFIKLLPRWSIVFSAFETHVPGPRRLLPDSRTKHTRIPLEVRAVFSHAQPCCLFSVMSLKACSCLCCVSYVAEEDACSGCSPPGFIERRQKQLNTQRNRQSCHTLIHLAFF